MSKNFAADSIIGTDAVFEGSGLIEGNARIDGHFVGAKLETNQLFIGSTGRVDADIEANVVVVEGTVVGNITAASRILLLSSARVFGDINTIELIIHDGVVMRGQCSIGDSNGDHLQGYADQSEGD